MARARFAFTITWILLATLVTVLRPTGTLKPGIIMFVLTPLPLIADIIRHRFSTILGRKGAPGVQPRGGPPQP